MTRDAVTGKTLPTFLLFLSQALGCQHPSLWLLIVHCWAWGLQGKLAKPKPAALGIREAKALALRPASSSLSGCRPASRAPQDLSFCQNHCPSEDRVLGPVSPPRCAHLCALWYVCIHSGVCVHVLCSMQACVQNLLPPWDLPSGSLGGVAVVGLSVSLLMYIATALIDLCWVVCPLPGCV